MTYLKNKKDANHSQVLNYLRVHGCEVHEFRTPLDSLVWRNGIVAWVEIKVPGSRACFTRQQLQYISSTRHNVVIATSPEEALMAMREKQWLSQKMKDGIAGMLIFSPKSKFTPADVAKAIGK
jgi:hypothetical protein